jgi:hypothetical protein
VPNSLIWLDFFFWFFEFGRVFFRTKSIKGCQLVQWVESYRNQEGQPRQRVIVSLGDAQLPDPEQVLIYQHLTQVPQLEARKKNF